MKQGLRLGILLVLIVSCCSWGFLVHRTINQLAVYELPGEMQPYFYRNMEYLVKNAPRPDERRNQDSTEATKHFVDLEMFEHAGDAPMPMRWEDAVARYGKDSLLEYGYVPYHIMSTKEKLTQAFRSLNSDSILFYAADLGHYIGDAHVPLHTTANYDGQLTNQKGMHSLWESMIPEMELEQYKLKSKHKAKYLKDPAAAIWKGVRQAAALLPEMFAQETAVSKQFTDSTKYRVQIRRGKEVKSYSSGFAKAYSAALKKTINEQLLRSADMIADFWYTAWVDAGKPDLSSITKPAFSETDKTKLDEEKKAFKKNELIEKKMLISRKQKEN